MGLILTLNAGSSSLKFGLYGAQPEPDLIVTGQVEKLGLAARLVIDGGPQTELGPTDHAQALSQIMAALAPYLDGEIVAGIGHRIVHGGVAHSAPVTLDEDAIAKLRALIPLAPLHQPHNLACVAAARAMFPAAPQVGCFDTAFHRTHPWVNDTFALPREFYDMGVRRYGFHGLSYDYITGVLHRDYPELVLGKVAVAHLGNGASICAVRNGQSVASTMGFSALDGLPMGTRSGQLDPGVVLYLMTEHGMSAEQITELLYRKSGLLGLSGVTSDMRTLEASNDPRAAQAIDYYVFRIQREIGAMAASMGGLDGVVFTGGIGENSSYIRGRVTEALGFLGVTVNTGRNAANETEIGAGATRVLIIPTDEERIIARAVARAVV
ncbi:acetate/propionate family kinase [Actibacterium sp. 188UL27-1]|uniref:acetate/propionate family kinase n=1 Tax=Actibacterium sp. 188UL27-1 TaxID=2786961 RepID=UPI00195D752A|nr:acetate/propionate family kinase [Actibacterium sp. 188UL27-1]MBM7066123.1 acetate/propionate family kinase [Actibacterium sp. 188UL27-1]